MLTITEAEDTASVQAIELGESAIDVLTGSTDRYAARELAALRQALQEHFRGSYAYEGFASMPRDPAARELLVLAINEDAEDDAEFRERVEDLVRRSQIAASGAGNVGVGRDNSGTVETRTKVASPGHNVGDLHGDGNLVVVGDGRIKARVGDTRIDVPLGGVLLAAAVVIGVVLLLGYLVGRPTSGEADGGDLTAGTTCADFMAEAPEVRDEAVRRIARELQQTQGSMDRLNVESSCSQNDSQLLGAVIRKVLPPAG